MRYGFQAQRLRHYANQIPRRVQPLAEHIYKRKDVISAYPSRKLFDASETSGQFSG